MATKPKNQPTKNQPTKNVPATKSDSLVLVQDQLPDYINPGSQRGNENVTTNDLVIPRLEIVQALSPAVKKGDPGFIQGAAAGMLSNSVTRQLYGEEVYVVPVYFSVQYLVWRARKDKNNKPLEGGFFGAYPNSMEAKARADAEGGEANYIEVIDTPTHLCLVIDPDTHDVQEVMMSMPRTKAKISRQWNSMIKLAGGDRFSRVYRIGTALEKKTQGDFYNFAIEQTGFPSKALYERALALYKAVSSGERRVVMDAEGLGGEDSEAGHGSDKF